MTASIPSRPPINPGPIASKSGQFLPGDRVEDIRDGRLGTVDPDAVQPATRLSYGDFVPVRWDGNDAWMTSPRVLRHLRGSLAERMAEAYENQTSGGGAVPSPAPPSDPTNVPDPDAPVGEVIDVVPGALVRRPGFVSSVRPSSSPAGLQAMKYAMDATQRALDAPAKVPSLTEVDEAESRGFQLAIERARAVLAGFARTGVAKGDDAGVALLAEVDDAIVALQDGGTP